MRLIVLSDTHGNLAVIERIISQNPISDHFLFLGDGVDEFEVERMKYPNKHFYSVLGNCDKGGAPEEKVVDIFNTRIYMAHGHLLGVRESLDTFLEKAKAAKADIALFGHTHIRYAKRENGIFVLNPGSASQPEDDLPPSYAFIDIGITGFGGAHIDLI